MSHFIICSCATMTLGIPKGQPRTQFEQEMQRDMVDELSNGMVLKPAVKYQRISTSKGTPRDNH